MENFPHSLGECVAFAAYVVLMWIENLALHMADKATKVWQIFSTVKKKKKGRVNQAQWI